jgi:argininosuccinate lyase
VSRLWDRGEPLDLAVLRLTVGRDPELDARLVPWDCLASTAWAEMLAGIGTLDDGELAALRSELRAIADEARAGTFVIAPEEEDGHTAIENRLRGRLGEVGDKIHTGRSRNDQVLAALRLWGRATLLDQVEGLLAVVDRLLELAESHTETVLPGYTHTRQAMSTTLGHHFVAWADNLLDGQPWLETAFAHLDRSPLGAGSGFGTALPLDRTQVAKRLGFKSLQVNTLAVQNDRGKSEYLTLAAAAAAATDLGRLATDLIWYSSDELGFVRLGPSVTTGSSIMPQKRNPDVLELIRAGAARLRARQAEVGAIYGPLLAGYQRDLQLTKEPFLEGMQSLCDMLHAFGAVLASLDVDVERCRRAVLPSTGATDAVYRRVAEGVPFRQAYREAAFGNRPVVDADSTEGWRSRTHAGAPGGLSLDEPRRRLATARGWLAERRAAVARIAF